ncbi:hypothetical protein [Acinetobacter bouvetii]|uniref:Uncharacterized protein n=1 Tax=Acinetobacter bouvetii TaxID=202951 RepID=A0A811G8J2_9GAMM|nr:hypothetical protein [Acinetobacter bouvetii]CAB1212596.1 hypothetical protein SFB21_1160 [Acinetobacter bouvetii]
MNYSIRIISQDEHVEESIWIEVNGLILNVFCSDYNFIFKTGCMYQVELDYEIFDEYQIDITETLPQFRKIDQSFAYEIIGRLDNGVLTVGDISFEDECLLSDFAYLDGKKIRLIVDRIKIYR